MKKIIITGTNGFIGKEFINLFNKKYEIIEVDLPFVDITKVKDINNLAKHKDIYSIIHLAALSNPKDSFLNPKKYFEVNLFGTLNLLKLCVKNNINNFFLMSSLTIYGSSNKILNENSKILPKHIYGTTKAAAEILCQTYSREYPININVLRPNLVIGSSKKPPDLINICVREALEHNKFTIFGDGEHIRDFVHVHDVCRAIECLIHYNKKFQAFCLGGNPLSINDLYNIIKQKLNHVTISSKPKNSSAFSLFCSNQKLQKSINFDLNISIEEMINKTITIYE